MSLRARERGREGEIEGQREREREKIQIVQMRVKYLRTVVPLTAGR